MTRQEPEGDGKVSRSYSLASAPLRLLSHSFHSTANTHTTNASNSSSTSNNSTLPIPPCVLEHLQKEDIISHHVPSVHMENEANHALKLHPVDLTESLSNCSVPSATLRHPEQVADTQTKRSRSECSESRLDSSTIALQSTASDYGHDIVALSRRPPKKALKLNANHSINHVPSASVYQQQQDQVDMIAPLERLLLPYDIRYSIFGHLSLQDIYHCQLTCKLLYWATSDQSIWKRIALRLIQGEFYFDIPRTLPVKIPNWKSFCKRHLLRQRNWRRGQVQDVISLDDNYSKLTTLQIMGPYVLTGCDDGRVHLWNVSTRALLHRFQIHGEITWVEHLQEQKIVAGLGYDNEKMMSEIRLFCTETGKQIGFYKEDFWHLAICAINGTHLVASDGNGRYTTWNWKTGAKVSHFKVVDENSSAEALYLVQDTILELHSHGLIRLFSIRGECYGRFTLDNILPNNQVSFCWLHNDLSMVVWESSNTMAHIRLPLLLQNKSSDGSGLARPISQEEWDAQGAEVFWRHQLEHTCNFAAMGGGRFQLLYVQIFENLMDHVPIRVHSLRHSGATSQGATQHTDGAGSGVEGELRDDNEGYGWQHGEYVTAHSLNPALERIIQGLRPSRIDCDPEYIAVGLVQGGVRLLQFAPVDEELF
ncbi:hypothetical protein EDD11_003392 [Mortierella claussenii]|nr:hypothetical protein EDD11_003392 [Mortierella claussenii]